MRSFVIIQALAALIFGALALSSCNGKGDSKEDNAVIEAIMNRRSIRKYQDKAVPRELLARIADCGIHAPNAMNAQRWEVRIVDSPAFIDGVTKVFLAERPEVAARNTFFKNVFRNAPAIICVAGQDAPFVDIDCGLMGQNMMLAAHSLGLGTCCLGGPVDLLTKSEAARPFYEALGFSEGDSLKYILAVGWPEETPDARPRDESKVQFVEF